MTAFKKQLLPVALLCNVLAAQASDVQMGDFWVVHYQGGLVKNQVVRIGPVGHIAKWLRIA